MVVQGMAAAPLRALSGAGCWIVRTLAASIGNALRALSGRSQGVGVVLAGESVVRGRHGRSGHSQGVVVVLAGESGRIGRREALRGAQGVETGETG